VIRLQGQFHCFVVLGARVDEWQCEQQAHDVSVTLLRGQTQRFIQHFGIELDAQQQKEESKQWKDK
jgi:hypothetical protein